PGARAQAVLDVGDLVLGPELLELAEDAAVIARVAIAIVLAFPRNDRRQMRWVQARHAPLVTRVVGDAQHADLAVAPRLRTRPLDALVDVLDLARAVAVQEPRRPSGAARIDAEH